MNSPLISIITPTLNSASTIGKAIQSVLNQEYKEIEHVFIDGLSSDETPSIIRASQNNYKHSCLINEKDNGIYDAMNKGLNLCKGDWIYFMGSDDEFYNDHVLMNIVNLGLLKEEQIVYGNVMIRGNSAWANDYDIYDGPFDLAKLFNKNICHQSIFYPRSVIQSVGYFSERYAVTADWDYNLRCYARYKFTYTDQIIAIFTSGGKSSKGDNGRFFREMPQHVISWFHLDPADPTLRNSESPFCSIMSRFDEQVQAAGGHSPPSDRCTDDIVAPAPDLDHPSLQDGVSLFTAVKNRKEIVESALQTWITHDEIDEIIIVDWDSDESLVPIVQKYQNGKIYLAIVQDQPKWILSQTFNLAARLTSRSMILKVDADVQVLPGFFKAHKLEPGIFYCGNWQLARNENEAHLNGNVFMFRNDFFQVNGYSEFFKTYGWDDTDLYARLESFGLKRLDIDTTKLHHIEHEARMIHQEPAHYLRNILDKEWARQNIFINRYLSSKLEKWSHGHTMMKFSIRIVDRHICICHQEGEDMNKIPPRLIREAERVAMTDRLGESGFNFPPEILNEITHEEMAELLEYVIAGGSVSGNPPTLVLRKISDLFKKLGIEKTNEISRLVDETQ